MGNVYIEGYGRYHAYYKGLFDKVGLMAHMVRAGKYKNAAETFVASAPSPETMEAESALWNTLWASCERVHDDTGLKRYTAAVEKPANSPAAAWPPP